MNLDAEQLQWYCLRAQPKREHMAARLLESQWGIEVCLPRIAHRKKTIRGPVRFIEPLFPGYLFARFSILPMLSAVRATGGVSGVVHFKGKIIAVDDNVVEEMLRLSPDGKVIEVDDQPRPGDTVVVAGGAFAGLRALVQTYHPAKERVRVLLEFLGRPTEVELPASLVVLSERRPVLT